MSSCTRSTRFLHRYHHIMIQFIGGLLLYGASSLVDPTATPPVPVATRAGRTEPCPGAQFGSISRVDYTGAEATLSVHRPSSVFIGFIFSL
ncbi:hypothetical protein OE88DRAFT_1668291, partial [Heliocybe sulcata]